MTEREKKIALMGNYADLIHKLSVDMRKIAEDVKIPWSINVATIELILGAESVQKYVREKIDA